MKIDCFNLKGKVAVVTGGATGIGRGISTGLAEAGATVVTCARREQICKDLALELADELGVRTMGLRCDVTKQPEIETAVEQVLEQFYGIDILVNCAGVPGTEKKILEMEPSDWDKVVDVNLRSIFLVSKAVVQTMVNQGSGGKIINVGSIGGLFATPRMSAYCASKAGLTQLTKVMAKEWARHDIQVNAILPGYFETPMNKEFFTTEAGRTIIKNKIPAGRIGKPDDIKGVAVLLASSASDYMTGSAVLVDGGQTTG